jgi:hypothetical protein
VDSYTLLFFSKTHSFLHSVCFSLSSRNLVIIHSFVVIRCPLIINGPDVRIQRSIHNIRNSPQL